MNHNSNFLFAIVLCKVRFLQCSNGKFLVHGSCLTGCCEVLQVQEKAYHHHADRAQVCAGLLPFLGGGRFSGHVPTCQKKRACRFEGELLPTERK